MKLGLTSHVQSIADRMLALSDKVHRCSCGSKIVVMCWIDEASTGYVKDDGSPGSEWEQDVESFQRLFDKYDNRLIYHVFNVDVTTDNDNFPNNVVPDGESPPEPATVESVSRDASSSVYENWFTSNVDDPSASDSEPPAVIKLNYDNSGSMSKTGDMWPGFCSFHNWVIQNYGNSSRIEIAYEGNERWLIWLSDWNDKCEICGRRIPSILNFPFEENAGTLFRSSDRVDALHNALLQLLSHDIWARHIRKADNKDCGEPYIDVTCRLLDDAGVTDFYPPGPGVKNGDDWINKANTVLSHLEGLIPAGEDCPDPMCPPFDNPEEEDCDETADVELVHCGTSVDDDDCDGSKSSIIANLSSNYIGKVVKVSGACYKVQSYSGSDSPQSVTVYKKYESCSGCCDSDDEEEEYVCFHYLKYRFWCDAEKRKYKESVWQSPQCKSTETSDGWENTGEGWEGDNYVWWGTYRKGSNEDCDPYAPLCSDEPSTTAGFPDWDTAYSVLGVGDCPEDDEPEPPEPAKKCYHVFRFWFYCELGERSWKYNQGQWIRSRCLSTDDSRYEGYFNPRYFVDSDGNMTSGSIDYCVGGGPCSEYEDCILPYDNYYLDVDLEQAWQDHNMPDCGNTLVELTHCTSDEHDDCDGSASTITAEIPDWMVGHSVLLSDGKCYSASEVSSGSPTPVTIEDVYNNCDDCCENLVQWEGDIDLLYRWDGSYGDGCDLDTRTEFLSGVSGWSCGDGGLYSTFHGDDTSCDGTERVTLHAKQALDDGVWSGSVRVECEACWYEGNSGGSTYTIQLTTYDSEGNEIDSVDIPGNTNERNSDCCTDGQGTTITIYEDGTLSW